MTKKEKTEEHKESSSNYDQYILSVFVTSSVILIGSAYFYSRIYKPFIQDRKDQFGYPPTTPDPTHVSPTSSELRGIPNIAEKFLYRVYSPEHPVNTLAGEIEAEDITE